jgi:hypothetical protein
MKLSESELVKQETKQFSFKLAFTQKGGLKATFFYYQPTKVSY